MKWPFLGQPDNLSNCCFVIVLGSAVIPKVSDLEDDNGIASTRSGEYLIR